MSSRKDPGQEPRSTTPNDSRTSVIRVCFLGRRLWMLRAMATDRDSRALSVRGLAAALEQAMVQGFRAIFPNGEALLPGLLEFKTGANWAERK